MHHQRQRRRLFLGGDPQTPHIFRQTRFGLRDPVLHLNLRLIGSVPGRKVTVVTSTPSEPATDFMYIMFSTPLIASSSGVATVSAITFGLAPDTPRAPARWAARRQDIRSPAAAGWRLIR
jgi:hypothetical protein